MLDLGFAVERARNTTVQLESTIEKELLESLHKVSIWPYVL